MKAHRISNRNNPRSPQPMVESDPPESPLGAGGLGPPSPEERWQHIRRWYCRGSYHLIVYAPPNPGFLDRKVMVVESPRRNLQTVRIEVDGRRMRWPIGWLRLIITDAMRKTLAEEAARRRSEK